jgi:hypothetical protein
MMLCAEFGRILTLISTHCRELMKSVGCHGGFICAIRGEEGDGVTLCERLSEGLGFSFSALIVVLF